MLLKLITDSDSSSNAALRQKRNYMTLRILNAVSMQLNLSNHVCLECEKMQNLPYVMLWHN
jgi:hypothetical protein